MSLFASKTPSRWGSRKVATSSFSSKVQQIWLRIKETSPILHAQIQTFHHLNWFVYVFSVIHVIRRIWGRRAMPSCAAALRPPLPSRLRTFRTWRCCRSYQRLGDQTSEPWAGPASPHMCWDVSLIFRWYLYYQFNVQMYNIDQYCTVVSVCRLCHWWIPLEVEAKAVRWLSPCCHPLPGMSLNTPGPGVSCSFMEFHGVSQRPDFEVWFRFSLTRKNYSKITCCIMLPPWQRMLPSLWTWFAAFTTSDLKGDCIKV